MPQFYLRDSNNAQTGPFSEAQIQERIRSGAFGPAHTVAIVDSGVAPTDGDFQRLSSALVAPGPSPSALPEAGRPVGTAFRVLSAIAVVLSVVIGVFEARAGGGFDAPALLAAVLQALTYGGLLWAAGTGLDLLNQIRRTS